MSVPSPALLDTSVVIDLDHIPIDALPQEQAICAITLAELAAGPHATDDADERARRQDRLQRIEALMDPLPFDADAARAYGRVYAATRAASRKPRESRAVDLMVAAVALSRSLPLVTRNPSDFAILQLPVSAFTRSDCGPARSASVVVGMGRPRGPVWPAPSS